MKIEYLKPETAYWSYLKMKIQDLYLLELTFTITNSIRVTVREKDECIYILNSCAGCKNHDALKLIIVILTLINMDMLEDAPFSSKVKPYYNDPGFVAYIMSFWDPLAFLDERPEMIENMIKNIHEVPVNVLTGRLCLPCDWVTDEEITQSYKAFEKKYLPEL